MSLINESGAKTRLYALHQNFFKTMSNFITDQKKINGNVPTRAQFNTKAIQVLNAL
jgi:hypothetical protein